MQKIIPFLWFDDNAEEAMNFYLSVFKNGKMLSIMPGKNGKAAGVSFELEELEMRALNGGVQPFTFNESISFVIDCETQDEIDYYWDKLSEGGQPGRCGWLKDKYGVSWQVVPTVLGKLLADPDPAKATRAMEEMLKMDKLNIKVLKKAAE